MPQFSSRELYMMNGGNKLYIYKDGFADDYHATAAEEAEWSKEIVEKALKQIDAETNIVSLRFAIDNLLFHGYNNVPDLLMSKLTGDSPSRTILFATMLWKMIEYPRSFGIIYQYFLNHRKEVLDDVFHAMTDFRNNVAARKFLYECLRGDDAELHAKAHTAVTMWAFTGLPELRAPMMLDMLKHRESVSFPDALQQLRTLLGL